jgi:hypothetical protein
MTQPSSAPAPEKPAGVSLEQWMAGKHAVLAGVLLGLSLLFAVLPLWQFIRLLNKQPVNFPLLIWGGWLALLCLFGGVYLRLTTPETVKEGHYRLLALALGGLAGLGTFVLGVALPLGPWANAFIPAGPTEDRT